MGTLTMALAAALLAGSGPEKISGETRQFLDLPGTWKGTLHYKGVGRPVRMEWGKLRLMEGKVGSGSAPSRNEFKQGRKGKCVIETFFGCVPCMYKVDGDRAVLWVRPEGGQPGSFRSSETQVFFTLHRVKPRK